MATTVLMVDDEADIRRIGQISLETVGKFHVLLATSGPEALSVAATEQPDVILLDVMMPGMDGPTTLGKLRVNPATAKIPVVFLTAKVQRKEIDQFVSLGAIGVIAKPFDPMTLADEVRTLLAGASGSGPPPG